MSITLSKQANSGAISGITNDFLKPNFIPNNTLPIHKPFRNLVEKECPKCNGNGHNSPMLKVDIPGMFEDDPWNKNKNKKHFPPFVCTTCGGKGVVPRNDWNIIM